MSLMNLARKPDGIYFRSVYQQTENRWPGKEKKARKRGRDKTKKMVKYGRMDTVSIRQKEIWGSQHGKKWFS